MRMRMESSRPVRVRKLELEFKSSVKELNYSVSA